MKGKILIILGAVVAIAVTVFLFVPFDKLGGGDSYTPFPPVDSEGFRTECYILPELLKERELFSQEADAEVLASDRVLELDGQLGEDGTGYLLCIFTGSPSKQKMSVETYLEFTLFDGEALYYDDECVEYLRYEHDTYGTVPLVNMSKPANERLSGNFDVRKRSYIILKFQVKREGLLYVDCRIEPTGATNIISIDSTATASYKTEASTLGKIEDLSIGYLSSADYNQGQFSDTAIKRTASFADGTENYMVIDLTYSATADNSGGEYVTILSGISKRGVLDATIESAPTSRINEVKTQDGIAISASFSLPAKAKEKKTIRYILRLLPVSGGNTAVDLFFVGMGNMPYTTDYYQTGEPLLTYTLSEDGSHYTVTGCNATASDITILDSLGDKKPVTAIAPDVFKGNTTIKRVVIGNNIERIEAETFYDCENLSQVVMGTRVSYIGREAFGGKNSLASGNFEIKDLAAWCAVELEGNTSSPFYRAAHITVNGTRIEDTNVLEIPKGVEKIGAYTFARSSTAAPAAQTLKIPDTVTEIGDYAFAGWSSLQSLRVPSSLRTIGYYAFPTHSLSSLTEYKGGLYAGNETNPYALLYATTPSLKGTLTIHKDARMLYHAALTEAAVSALAVEDGNSILSSDGETLFAYSGSLLLYYLKGSAEKSYTVPASVTYISPYIFSESNIEEIIFSSAYTEIGHHAFYNCKKLKSVVMQGGSIGENAFSLCQSLSSVTTNAERIADYAFYACKELKSLSLSGTEWIGDRAFSDCAKLTAITIPGTTVHIGEEALFGCIALKRISVPFIGESADATDSLALFGYFFGKEKRDGTTEVKQYVVDPNSNEYPPTLIYTSYYIPSALQYVTVTGGRLTEGAFYNCAQLKTIILDGVTSIDAPAFVNCTALQTLLVSDSVTMMSSFAISGCRGVTLYMVPKKAPENWNSDWNSQGSPVVWGIDPFHITEDGYIFSESAENATLLFYIGEQTAPLIPETINGKPVTAIAAHAFKNQTALTAITLPSGLLSIGESAFEGCKALSAINIPVDITEIGKSAFSGCTSLKTITIPSSVTSIGESAFKDCSSLTIYCESASQPIGWDSNWNPSGGTVVWATIYMVIDGIRYTLKDGAATVIEQESTITTANIPESISYRGTTYSVTSIGASAFKDCRSLTTLTIPSTVTTIGEYAFYHCSSLEAITIPDSVTSIGEQAFYGCTIDAVIDGIRYYLKDGTAKVIKQESTITTANIPASVSYKGTTYSVTSIAASAFKDCSSLTTLTIPASVTYIGEYAFYHCSSLEAITIPASVTFIDTYAFYGCTSLITVTFATDSRLKSIGEYAFYGCTSLSTFALPSSVTSVGQYAFKDCNLLIQKENGVFYVDTWVVGYDTTATAITLRTGTAGIADYAFKDCTSLNAIEIPSSVTTIGNYAFYGCTSLNAIEIPSSVTKIGNYAFYGCTSLNAITIPSSITTIGNYAFYGCTSLVDATVPSSVTRIGNYAFYGCTSLNAITIPSSVTTIGEFAFYNCTELTIYCEATSRPDSGWASYWKASDCPVVWGTLYTVIDGIRYTLKDGVATVIGQKNTITTANIPESIGYRGTTYSVTSIGASAFYGCTSLTTITIPASITNIGSWAFADCTSLTTVTFAEGGQLTTIGYYVFYRCSSLTEITIPSSVTSIGDSAFYNCTSLLIYCEATSPPSGWHSSWNFSKCPVVWDCNNNDVATDGYIHTVIDGIRYTLKDGVATVTRQKNTITTANIPELINYRGTTYSVKSISASAFDGCTSLTTITIPASITNIGSRAFADCTSLTIYCEAKRQPSGWNSNWNPSKCPVVWGQPAE